MHRKELCPRIPINRLFKDYVTNCHESCVHDMKNYFKKCAVLAQHDFLCFYAASYDRPQPGVGIADVEHSPSFTGFVSSFFSGVIRAQLY